MRHSKAEKAKTHERIVAVASKRFREEGLAGIGIADLMKEAGLTVGGFYKHFNSRGALVAEAVGCALELWKRQVDAAASGGAKLGGSIVRGQQNHGFTKVILNLFQISPERIGGDIGVALFLSLMIGLLLFTWRQGG